MTAKNPIIKLIGVLLAVIIGLWLILVLINGTGSGFRIGFSGNHDGGHLYMGYGLGLTGTISFLLLSLIKILFVLFIVGLIAGIAMAIKNYMFTAEDVEKIKGTFTGKKTAVIKEKCSTCGKELENDWKVCPYCGKEANNQNI
ncbi:MAG: zinc ribbon domain-containing protein [Clostridia bacterium]|nr:zinc ribbon domain-containing protein [Clostridia bacterium]